MSVRQDSIAGEPADVPTISVPLTNAVEPLGVRCVPGEATVFVGANGSGKSALAFFLEFKAPEVTPWPVRRVIAHRRIWLSASGPDLTSAQRENMARNVVAWSRSGESRWQDHANDSRPSLALFDLIEKENEFNRAFRQEAVVTRSFEDVARDLNRSPFETLNDVLAGAGLRFQVRVGERGRLESELDDGSRYEIKFLSDGEKNALLLAAEVLSAPDRSIQILDEPERHLHRSISAGLIEALLAERSDCHFVLVTHDLELADRMPASTTHKVALFSCKWNGSNAESWDAFDLDQADGLAEEVRRAVLGGRKKLLFVEGGDASLDIRLYSALYPDWEVTPLGGCEEVIRAVKGVSLADQHHWISARGIIDADQRTSEERAELARCGVFCLGVSEIENIYFLPKIASHVALAQEKKFESAEGSLLPSAEQAALAALDRHDARNRVASVVAHARMRLGIESKLPAPRDIPGSNGTLDLRVEIPYEDELSQLRALINGGSIEEILKLYPIRESGFRDSFARALKFHNHSDYEQATLVAIRGSLELSELARDVVGFVP